MRFEAVPEHLEPLGVEVEETLSCVRWVEKAEEEAEVKKRRTEEKSLNQIGNRYLNLVRERKVHPGCAFQYYEVDGLIEKKDARLLDYGGVYVGWIADVCRSTHSQPRLNRRTMTGEDRGICTRAGPPCLATADSCSFCVKFEATPEPA